LVVSAPPMHPPNSDLEISWAYKWSVSNFRRRTMADIRAEED
jgi:hypothetical protein